MPRIGRNVVIAGVAALALAVAGCSSPSGSALAESLANQAGIAGNATTVQQVLSAGSGYGCGAGAWEIDGTLGKQGQTSVTICVFGTSADLTSWLTGGSAVTAGDEYVEVGQTAVIVMSMIPDKSASLYDQLSAQDQFSAQVQQVSSATGGTAYTVGY